MKPKQTKSGKKTERIKPSTQPDQSRAREVEPEHVEAMMSPRIGAVRPQGQIKGEPTEECPATREDKVRAIMAMMPHSWVRGKTGAEVAARWGLAVESVGQLAAEAWRRVRAQDPSYVRDKLASALEQSVEEVQLADEPATAKAKAIAVVTGAWAPLVGASAAQKVEVTQGPPPGLPSEVADAWGKPDDASRRRVHRHVLLEALAALDEWPHDERTAALADVRAALARLEAVIVQAEAP